MYILLIIFFFLISSAFFYPIVVLIVSDKIPVYKLIVDTNYGQVLFTIKPFLLTNIQAFTQRYTHPSVWDYGFSPLLFWPTWIFITIWLITFVLLIFSINKRFRKKYIFYK